MLDGVLHDRLQQHAGHKGLERALVHVLEDLQIVAAEASHFDVQIIVDKTELFVERHEGLVLAQQAAKDIAQLQDDDARQVGIIANQRRDRIERVEQEMRIDLAGERVHARLQQQLLVLLEIHLDARVVPDLDGNGDGHHRSQQEQRDGPASCGRRYRKATAAWSRGQALTGRVRAPGNPRAEACPTWRRRVAQIATANEGALRNVKGPKSQMSSLFGIA